jgi:hypothetical protein
MTRHSPSPLIVLALAAAALTGCSPTPAPTPSPTPAFATGDEAFAAAEKTYRAYIDASNAIDLRNPRTFDALDSFTAGSYRADERKSLSKAHAQGYSSSGAIAIDWFEGARLEDDKVFAVACNDVSQTTLADSNGTSLVATDRPSRYALSIEFIIDDSDVRIIHAESVGSETCSAE